MAHKIPIRHPDYVGAWFNKLAPALNPTTGPFVVYLDTVVPPHKGSILDSLGPARLTHGKFGTKQVEFVKTYLINPYTRRARLGSPYHYRGRQTDGVISGTWEVELGGKRYSGEFLMQMYTNFLKARKGATRLTGAWLDAQMEALQYRHLAGIEARLITSAEEGVILIG
jgi:hypothetical protein